MNKAFIIPKRIESIQVLRFAAAFCIFLYHFDLFYNDIPQLSRSVDLFMMLSGFVVMLSTRRIEKRKHFLGRRLIRLLPLYYLVTVAVFVVALFYPAVIGYKPDFSQLIKSLLFIPFERNALKSEDVLRPILGMGYTLQLEVAFTLVFLASMWISHKFRGIIASGICVSFFFIGYFVEFENSFCKFYFNKSKFFWLFFAVGMLVFYLVEFFEKRNFTVKKALPYLAGLFVLFAAAVVFNLAFNLHDEYFNHKYSDLLVFGLLIFFTVVYSVMGFKCHRPFVIGGDMSYSFYVIHYFAVSVIDRLYHPLTYSPLNIGLILLAFAVSAAVSYISKVLIEDKLSSKLLKLFRV